MPLYRVEKFGGSEWVPVDGSLESSRMDAFKACKQRQATYPGLAFRIHAVPMPKVDRAGIAYFDSDHAAAHAALRAGWPTEFIRCYGLGWAVQRRDSGPYLLRADYLAATREARDGA